VIDPTVAYPADSRHFGSAWRNTNSYAFSPGMGWVFPFHLSPLREPLTVGLTARAAKVPAGWAEREDVTAIRRALEFAGAANRVPMFLIPELREKLPRADLGLRLHDEDRAAKEAAAEEATSSRTMRAGEATAFYLSGTVPGDAKKGDIYLVNVAAHYPATKSQRERAVGYLEVIYVK
jgi:hypothetical protein